MYHHINTDAMDPSMAIPLMVLLIVFVVSLLSAAFTDSDTARVGAITSSLLIAAIGVIHIVMTQHLPDHDTTVNIGDHAHERGYTLHNMDGWDAELPTFTAKIGECEVVVGYQPDGDSYNTEVREVTFFDGARVQRVSIIDPPNPFAGSSDFYEEFVGCKP